MGGVLHKVEQALRFTIWCQVLSHRALALFRLLFSVQASEMPKSLLNSCFLEDTGLGVE